MKTFVKCSAAAGALAAAALAAPPARAQVQVDKLRTVTGDAVIEIDNSFGRITVIGWDRSEVRVKGTLAPGAEGLDFDSEPYTDDDCEDCEKTPKKQHKVTRTHVSVSVSTPDSWTFESDDDTDYRSVLEISVPRGAELHIESINAPILVGGVTGEMAIESVNGPIAVNGGSGEIHLESLTGNVEYAGAGRSLRIETVSGAVKVDTQNAEIGVRTVKGDIAVKAKTLSEVQIESTAGNVTVDGAITAEGEWAIETFSGGVGLTFPGAASGHFHLRSAEGPITSNVGPKPRREERFTPFRVLEFRTGSADAQIDVETFSGPITVKAAAGAP